MRLALAFLLLAIPASVSSETYSCALPDPDYALWIQRGQPPATLSRQVEQALGDEQCFSSRDQGYREIVRRLSEQGVCAVRPMLRKEGAWPALFLRKTEDLWEEWRVLDEQGCRVADPYKGVWYSPRYRLMAYEKEPWNG